MSSDIEIDMSVFDSIYEEEFVTPQLEAQIAADAEAARLQALTGSRVAPIERAKEFLSNPIDNIATPISDVLTDTASGAVTGLAGIAQVSAAVQETARQGFDWLVGEEYTDVEKEKYIQLAVTDPELARQNVYSNYRQKVSGSKPSPIAGFIGEVVPTMVANPKKVAQGFFGKVLQSSFYGGLSGSMEFVEGGQNERNMNTLIGTSTGGILDSLQQAGRRAVRVGKEAWNPSVRDFADTPEVDLAAKLSTGEVNKVLAAARGLGITVTPAEASGDSLLIHGQNTLNINQASREQLSEFLVARNDALTENILSLQRVADKDLQYAGVSFVPASGQPAKAPFVTKQDQVKWKTTREEVFRQTLEPEELTAVLGASPLLANAYNKYVKALNKPASKRTDADALAIEAVNRVKKQAGIVGDMPLNNVGFLDMLVRDLDVLLDKTIVDPSLVRNQRKAMSGVLKRRVEGYESLKQQQQRALAVSNLQNVVDPATTRPEDFAETFYNNVLRDRKKREELLRQLETDPTAKKKVEDLTLVMSHIFSDAGVTKLIKGAEKDVFAQGTGGGGTLGAIALKFREIVRNDSGLINVITNPQWTSDISKLKGRTSNETLQNVTAFLSRVVNTTDKIETSLGVKQQTREEAIQQMINRQ